MADENSVDTVTPLDGDGKNVVFPNPAGAGVFEDVTAGLPNVKQEDYETKGRTTVATPYGYAFASSDKDVPVITHEGIQVTAEQAAALVAESDEHNGGVYIRNNDTEEV